MGLASLLAASGLAFAIPMAPPPPGTATFTVPEGYELADAGFLEPGNLTNYGSFLRASMQVEDRLDNHGFMSMGDGRGEGTFIPGGDSAGQITNHPTGIMLFDLAGVWLDIYSPHGSLVNHGTIRVTGNGAGFALVRGQVINHGDFIVASPNMSCAFDTSGRNSGTIINGGRWVVNAGTRCEGYSTNKYPNFLQLLSRGETLVNGRFAAKSLYIRGGVLGGAGTLTVSGAPSEIGPQAVLSPGAGANRTGTLTVNGPLTLEGGLDMEIAGTAAGTFDAVTINGNATLGGTLNVLLRNGYTPAAGSVFPILAATSATGEFARLNLPPLPSGLAWSVEYTGTTVNLRVQ
jgi:hypothetical protein